MPRTSTDNTRTRSQATRAIKLQQEELLKRSNTSTTMSSFFFGSRKAPQPPEGVPAPPPMYQHVGLSLSQAQAARAALRASKLGTLDKFSSADRIANWMETTDKELGGLERWRREVARELVKEQQTQRGAPERLVVAREVDKPLPDLPAPSTPAPFPPSQSNATAGAAALPADAPTADLARANSKSQYTDSTLSPAIVATAVVHPFAMGRAIDRSTVILGRDPIELPPAPKTPAGFVPPVVANEDVPPLRSVPPSSYRFPPSSTPSFPAVLPANADASRPPLPSAFSSPSTGESAAALNEPKPWGGVPPPRTSSLPFGNLVQAPTDTPAHCQILPPKAAALLGLIPSASAPLRVGAHHKAASASALPSPLLSIDTTLPPRPPFRHYDSATASTTGYGREDSLDSASVSGSTRTAGSFWSSTVFGRRNGSSAFLPGRPSFESGSAPTTASPSQHQPKSSFSASLAQSLARGTSTRRKAPPPALRSLHLRREGMSSLPDLTTPLAHPSTVAPLAPPQPAYHHHGGDDEDEQESLVDVFEYVRRPPPGYGRARDLHAGERITASSLVVHRPPRSSSRGAGSVGSLARSLSNGRSAASGFLSRKLSRRASKQDLGGGGGIGKTLAHKLSFRREPQAVRLAPEPTPVVEKRMRRKTRDEWEMESAVLAGRLRNGL
ncbi:hypothetical protein JCM10213_000548 [Rhodosporidiobolus nylandii]